MSSSIHKAILASFAIVALVLLLPVTQVQADQMLVCVATENAFDALDNNCDGEVDDAEELDNLGSITGADWYKTIDVGTPEELCTSGSENAQCFSSSDTGGCTQSESGGYFCDVSFDGSNSGGSSSSASTGSGSGSSPSSAPTSGVSPASSPSAQNPISASTPTSTGSTPTPVSTSLPGEETNNNICAYFLGVEKCLTESDNGNDCVSASGGLFYCSEVPNQQPDSGICVSTNEVYNGIDDNCDGQIDEGVEPLSPSQTSTVSGAAVPANDATVVSAPATAFIFAVGVMALLYTRRKSLVAKK